MFYFGQHSLLAFFVSILITRDKTLSYLQLRENYPIEYNDII
ncbi:hypothetical protein VCHE25_3347 [Vibrio cholerae HE-25]|nr:hypothetical protein VCHE25_3347 [Vibrio cholerae HE-25]